ncbi:superoxide dismutase family protein [Ichthyenterobacterium magnum]|uniref:Cu-Zn family superoxide dismutase n=1 Tax=Ichthyenterobacterium magnum TaxID=1230530 RepID=A0A420DLF4_9FLAO|nr:superoxide dismutase family protein [Ichthyenterobacterium magnum]RKE95031.1 Cu-Zn family superoxide dismutase [Ichthyenterobacterium magnum]
MKKSIFIVAILSLSIITACKNDKKETETATEVVTEQTEDATKKSNEVTTPKIAKERPSYYNEKKELRVQLDPKSGSSVEGKVLFTQDKGIVTMVAFFKGLSEGTHAIHLHEKADCSSEDGKSAGGHWNPTGQPHGKWGSTEGYHKGDIGNIEANANGSGTLTFSTSEWCIGCGDKTKDIVGKGIIVHAGADDYSQPTGAAGGRMSCGGIIQ